MVRMRTVYSGLLLLLVLSLQCLLEDNEGRTPCLAALQARVLTLRGTCVYVRNRSVMGRNKIQDYWDSTPYQVVGRPDPRGPVYIVEPQQGRGPRKTLNRRDILEAPERGLEDSGGEHLPKCGIPTVPPRRGRDRAFPEEASSGSSDSEGEGRVLFCSQTAGRPLVRPRVRPPPGEGVRAAVAPGSLRTGEQQGQPRPRIGPENKGPVQQHEQAAPEGQAGDEGTAIVRTGEQLEQPVADKDLTERPQPAPRRSNRTTAGRHGNLHRLPKTLHSEEVCIGERGADETVLAQMAETQLLLAQMMAATGQ